mmetsp:Transcript_21822/g.51942  ORF Transcript_21822/g.51942 Transcript_21822/m.51942 type:complete len:205 (+) Transcript_21822:1476-2090(+)
MPADTLTFSESTPVVLLSSSSPKSTPPIPEGIRANSVQAFATRFLSPCPSEPKTSKIGRSSPSKPRTGRSWRSYNLGGRSSPRPVLDVGTDAEAPITRKPSSLAWFRVRGRLVVLYTSTTSRAPALDALTTGLGGAEFFEHTRTPMLKFLSLFLPPKKYADRNKAPRFCGSTTSSRTSHKAGEDCFESPPLAFAGNGIRDKLSK